MSEPIILSDEEEEEEDHHNAPSSLLPPFPSKKRRTQFDPNPNPTVLILDDDPTPQKPGPKSTVYLVPDTPNSDIAIMKCTRAAQHKLSGINGLICLESDNEPGSSCGGEKKKENMDQCWVVLVWPRSWIGVRVLLSPHVHLDHIEEDEKSIVMRS